MDKKLIGLMGIFFLFFIIFSLAVVLPPSTLTSLTQAQGESLPSAETTRILAWPLYGVKADGHTESSITVIVRNAKTKPIEGRLVSVASTLGTVRETATPTNKEGMVIFHLVSNSPGTANINVTIDNSVQASQNVSVQFVE